MIGDLLERPWGDLVLAQPPRLVDILAEPCQRPVLLYVPEVEERTLVTAERQGDVLVGTDGHDEMRGSVGNDVFLGGPGFDFVRGGRGDDTVDYLDSPCPVIVDLAEGRGWGGHAHGDTYRNIENVVGSRNDDTLTGNNGPNRLEGGHGDDVVDGAGGDDRLRGGQGDDALLGGAGDDVVDGWSGSDTMTGGAGADVFVFAFAPGDDVVTDFDPAEDRIQALGQSWQTFMAYATDVGGDVVYARTNEYLGYDTTFTIENVTLADLSPDVFIFA